MQPEEQVERHSLKLKATDQAAVADKLEKISWTQLLTISLSTCALSIHSAMTSLRAYSIMKWMMEVLTLPLQKEWLL